MRECLYIFNKDNLPVCVFFITFMNKPYDLICALKLIFSKNFSLKYMNILLLKIFINFYY